MFRTAVSFPVLLVLFVSFTLNVSDLKAQYTRRSVGKSLLPEVIGLKSEKRGCCGMRSVPGRLSAVAEEYEYSRLTGTYYSLRDGLQASLMLNNKGPEPILATPTFYSMAGTRLQLAAIVVPAASYLDVDLHQLLANVADEFREGSLKISYQAPDQQLGAQIKLTDSQKKLIWAEQLVYTSKFVSNRLEHVWWLPGANTKTRFVVSNTSSAAITATIKVDGTTPNQASPYQVTLAPWETRVLDILSDLVGNANGSLHPTGGISIEHTGDPGQVLARMYISRPNVGYSATAAFIDPENTASQRWHGSGFRFRNVDGTVLKTGIAVRNISTQLSRVKGKIIYTNPNGDLATIVLPERQIAAGASKVFDLGTLIENANVPAAVQVGGIEVEYDTPMGTIITSVQSGSPNGQHIFQVPMFDPQKMPSSAGGFPWKADGDYSTIVYIKNETDQPRKYTAHLLYSGGQYSLGVRELKPGETTAIDFRKVRDDQTPDSIGRIIPLEIDRGQIAWSVKGGQNKSLSGRSEQISLSDGVASTYACYNCCPDSVYQTELLPSYIELEYGTSSFLSPAQTDMNCYYSPVGPYVPSGVFWNSDNVGVVSVLDGTLFSEGVGTATISATWDTCLWWVLDGQCDPVCDQTTKNSSAEVKPSVTITPFEAVGKDGTFSVPVQVLGNTNGSQITLELRKLSGTGESLFTNGNSPTISITQSGNYEIKGITESSVKDNYVIEAKLGNSVLRSEAFSIAKIKLSRTIGTGQPSEITSTTINTIVGERIKLAAEVVPAGVTVSSHQWTIPQKIMKDFVVTANTSSIVSVTGLNTASADFVWYDGSDGREVTYTATSGGSLVGKATFNVKRPEASVITISTSQSVTTIDSATGTLELHYGLATAQTAGIRFSLASISIPSPFAGDKQWVQTINRSATVTPVGGTQTSFTQTGLDGCYPYAPINQNSTFDSPGVQLAPFSYVNFNQYWSMWLMFKPSGSDSSWVPLRKVDWRWLAEAELISSSWSLLNHTNPNSPSQPTDVDATEFPIWTSVVPSDGGCF